MSKLGLIHQLNENVDKAELQKIADRIFALCEGAVADEAADEGGRGFSGNAVSRKCTEVCSMIKDLVEARIKKENS